MTRWVPRYAYLWHDIVCYRIASVPRYASLGFPRAHRTQPRYLNLDCRTVCRHPCTYVCTVPTYPPTYIQSSHPMYLCMYVCTSLYQATYICTYLQLPVFLPWWFWFDWCARGGFEWGSYTRGGGGTLGAGDVERGRWGCGMEWNGMGLRGMGVGVGWGGGYAGVLFCSFYFVFSEAYVWPGTYLVWCGLNESKYEVNHVGRPQTHIPRPPPPPTNDLHLPPLRPPPRH